LLDLLDFRVARLIRTALVLCLKLSLSDHIVTKVNFLNLVFLSQPSLLPVIQFFIFLAFVLKKAFKISTCKHFQVDFFEKIRFGLFLF
jgi:hypothetical protein